MEIEKLKDALKIIEEIIEQRLVVRPKELSAQDWECYKGGTRKLEIIRGKIENTINEFSY